MPEIVTYIEIDTPAFEITSPMGPDITWRFAEPTEYLDRGIACVPSIANVSYEAAIISLGENLGQRASLSVNFRDHRHVMNGEPFGQGTFWGKWRARYGQKLRGRPIRLIRGFAGQPIDEMEARHFFVESTNGPTPEGSYSLVAKDLLKFADDDRAQAPKLSNGRLAGSIDADDVSAVLTPAGIGDFEYPADGLICLGGKEVVAFTRSGDNLSITRAQMSTLPQSHNSGDRAQLVLWYDGDDVADIIRDLLVTYAGVDPDYVPLADWQAETAANLSIIYARAITEPTPVNKLISELVEQAALALWWDERAQIVRLQVLREIATDAAMFDESVILQGSLKVRDQPERRISQIWSYYGQRNPADRGDNEDNYRAALATVDLVRQDEYGSPLIRKIIGKWVATLTAAERLNGIQISRFRDPPRRFNFDLFQGASVLPGGGYRLSWRQNQDVTGAVVAEGAPIQITRVSTEPGIIHVEAEEMLASGTIVVTKTVILTTLGGLQSWTVPDDWNDADNRIEVLGAGAGGGGGNSNNGGRGGGGGAYSAIVNQALTPSSSIDYQIGAGGLSATDGGETWFGAMTFGGALVAAQGGFAGGVGSSGGQGGQASAGIGTVKFSGGNGGTGSNRPGGTDHAAGGGGAGAAGPAGAGANGGNASGGGSRAAGGGGGGADDGSAGADGFENTGGVGGNNRFGVGGGTTAQPIGQEGGGGKGGDRTENGSQGGVGQGIWTQTIAPITSAGPGGGGGGAGSGNFSTGLGGPGGLFGGGGGGAGVFISVGAVGAQGVIAITWRPGT